MEVKRKLLTKFTAGFLLVIAPLVCILFYITFYSIELVRNQVALSNHNLLFSYQDQIDQTIYKATNYLYNLYNVDVDFNLLETMEYGSLEYIMFKFHLLKIYQEDLGLYPEVDSFFMYSYKFDDLTLAGKPYTTQEREQARKQLKAIIDAGLHKNWNLMRKGDYDALVMIDSLNNGFYVGCVISPDSLIQSVNYIDLGEKGFITFVSENGQPLSSRRNLRNQELMIKNGYDYRNMNYSVVENEQNERYLVMSQKSKWMDLYLVIVILEENLLQSLNILKSAIYLIPLIMLVILIAYWFFLRKVLINPINSLVRGIRSVSRGDLEARVAHQSRDEFLFLIQSFNNMVSQINDLKIDVYEQKLRAEQAKYNHLQLQINPHFYMNTLNIIYNLAALKQHKTVQKLSLYLADYFRFIVRTNRENITLMEELKHIGNYLDIQKLRFPDVISYELDVPEELNACMIPPLTIQTFVENCIVHGFQNSSMLFQIKIHAQSRLNDSGHYLEIRIEDNGRGFPPDKLEELQKQIFFDRHDGQHLGIRNVFERLQLMYNSEIQIAFANKSTGGAVISVLMPMKTSL